MSNHAIAFNLAQLQAQICAAEQRYARPAGSVRLLAVTKRQSVADITQAILAGQTVFGENYLQEALPKITALASHYPPLEWHFIGALQANKARAIAAHFSWAHSIDNAHIARRLNALRPIELPPLNICLQVNVDDEPQKAGVSLAELPRLAAEVSALPRLRLRGLMALPAPREEVAAQRAVFHKVHLAQQQLQAQGFILDTLSMGMSGDFDAAIAEGATLVRIGSAIFGQR